MTIACIHPTCAQIPVEHKDAKEFLNVRIYPLRDAENGASAESLYPNRLQINVGQPVSAAHHDMNKNMQLLS